MLISTRKSAGIEGTVRMKASSLGPTFSTVFLNIFTAGKVDNPLLEAAIPPSTLRLVKSSSRPVGPSADGDPNGPRRTPAEVEVKDPADPSALALMPDTVMVSTAI